MHFLLPKARVAALALFPLLLFAARARLRFGPWHRASETPIISPQGTTWQSAGTFNPAVVLHNGKFVMLYRAQDGNGTSHLGYAESSNGIHFTRHPESLLSPETAYENDGDV